MAKKKLARFAEMEVLPNVFQPKHEEVFRTDYPLKGKWNEGSFITIIPSFWKSGAAKENIRSNWENCIPKKILSDWISRVPVCGKGLKQL